MLVGKKLGPAPLRNRHKRWAREAFRRQRAAFPRPGSVIIRFSRPAEHYEHVRRALHEAYYLAIQDRRRPD
ncbi:MAG: hypothetical protein C4524_10610 [Candidatus Zixiibacteriota bacterium]|nr:MAG: hypothetical protein C4524_10610 [candidate division Zixibacteria bacterium]